MNVRFLRFAGCSALLFATILISGCHKKAVPSAPAKSTPPPPAAPTATISATPLSLQRGESAQLSWSSENATEVNIDGLGAVPASGTRSVRPTESTTYRMTAKGPGGSAEAVARVSVTVPPPPPAPVPSAAEQAAQFNRSIKDVYFDYDRYELRASDGAVVKADADFLAAHPGYNVLISGHCDERGSVDYNVTLGSSRADAVRDALVKYGVSGDRIKTISYGKEKPFCSDSNEACWQQNRRAHFAIAQ